MNQISIEKPNFCKDIEIGLFNYASFYNIFYKAVPIASFFEIIGIRIFP